MRTYFSWSVFMCACIYICIYICMYIYIYIYKSTYTYIYNPLWGLRGRGRPVWRVPPSASVDAHYIAYAIVIMIVAAASAPTAAVCPTPNRLNRRVRGVRSVGIGRVSRARAHSSCTHNRSSRTCMCNYVCETVNSVPCARGALYFSGQPAGVPLPSARVLGCV